MFDALNLKVASMFHIAFQCVLTFDEISLKSALAYNSQRDFIEGFENFGDLGQSKYMATHALVFMVSITGNYHRENAAVTHLVMYR